MTYRVTLNGKPVTAPILAVDALAGEITVLAGRDSVTLHGRVSIEPVEPTPIFEPARCNQLDHLEAPR